MIRHSLLIGISLLVWGCDSEPSQSSRSVPRGALGTPKQAEAPTPPPKAKQHIQCVRPNGQVVIDTDDIGDTPTHDGSTWGWRNRTKSRYTRVSTPPLECIYTVEFLLEDEK